MRKILNIITMIMIISMVCIFIPNTRVNAENDKYTLQLKEINDKDIELYVLLPKEYVLFAIQKDGLNISYEGVQTLINYEIPSIKVESGKVHKDVYQENGIEYVQILLNKSEDGNYKFDVLSDYEKMDIKFRAIVTNGDYIVHIDNFKIKNNLCEIEYDSEKNTVKQPDESIVSIPATAIILVLIIMAVIIGGSSKGGSK